MEKTLVLIHGFLGSSQDFSQIQKDLSSSHRVIALDLPLDLEHFSLKNISKSIYQKLTSLHVQKAIFVGYSMGGRIALELYRNHPEMFEKLVLISASPGIRNEKDRESRLLSDLNWAEVLQADVCAFLEKWYAQDLFKSFREHAGFASHLRIRKNHVSLKHAQMLVEASPATNLDHFDLLGQIQIPVLVLLGEYDLKYQNLWSNLVANLPHIKLKTISHAGHVVHLENSNATANAINNFINSAE